MTRTELLLKMEMALEDWFKREFVDTAPPDGEMGERASIRFRAFSDGRGNDDEPLFSLLVETSRDTNT